MKTSPKLRQIRMSNVAKAREKWLSMSRHQRKAIKVEKQVKSLKTNLTGKIRELAEIEQAKTILKRWEKENPDIIRLLNEKSKRRK